jgi:hypothetical protein
MPHINSTRRTPAATAVVVVLLLACLGLAACGGSSKSSSTSTNAAAATSTGGGAATGPAGLAKGETAKRFSALRECLQKNGITLPQRTPGQRRSPGGTGGFLGGGAAGPQLPKGVTRAQYEAALKKCGGGNFAGRGAGARFSSPAFKAALAKFAACLRENGVNVPAPNTSGKGPIFDTTGLNTASAQFRTAETKCSSDLRSSFRRGSGAGGAPPAGSPGGAAPPAGAGG